MEHERLLDSRPSPDSEPSRSQCTLHSLRTVVLVAVIFALLSGGGHHRAAPSSLRGTDDAAARAATPTTPTAAETDATTTLRYTVNMSAFLEFESVVAFLRDHAGMNDPRALSTTPHGYGRLLEYLPARLEVREVRLRATPPRKGASIVRVPKAGEAWQRNRSLLYGVLIQRQGSVAIMQAPEPGQTNATDWWRDSEEPNPPTPPPNRSSSTRRRSRAARASRPTTRPAALSRSTSRAPTSRRGTSSWTTAAGCVSSRRRARSTPRGASTGAASRTSTR